MRTNSGNRGRNGHAIHKRSMHEIQKKGNPENNLSFGDIRHSPKYHIDSITQEALFLYTH